MTQKDQIFVVNAIVINPTQETMTSNVINQPINAAAKLSAIVKIHKYKGLHEGHYFIPMATKVHGTPKRDVDCFIRESVRLFHNR
jgi:hypothetical protein